jgi:hypothetical protein
VKKIIIKGCQECPYKVRLPERMPEDYRAICAHHSLAELDPVWAVNLEYVYEGCRLADETPTL